MKMKRISKKEYYLGLAKAASERSTCIRRKYGAIIVNNDEVIATGYNGAARGCINCCDIGKCYRMEHNIPHGEQYEKCVAVHAEQNAIISASRKDMLGATLYIAGFEGGEEFDAVPCKICSRMILNSGIKKIISIGSEMTCEELKNMM